jgi:hypothetical protein
MFSLQKEWGMGLIDETYGNVKAAKRTTSGGDKAMARK